MLAPALERARPSYAEEMHLNVYVCVCLCVLYRFFP